MADRPGAPVPEPEPLALFDRVARVYRWAEYALLGPLLQRTRTQFLPAVLTARQALVLGDGDGRFLAALLKRSPELQATAVDTSGSMLDLLLRRCRFASGRLTMIQGSATEVTRHLDLSQTDLVVTHFFLDCLSQPEVDDLAQRLGASLHPGALWLVSEFGTPQRQPWRILGRLYVRGLYHAFGILTGLRVRSLPDLEGPLIRAGFTPLHRHERLKGLLYSQVWILKGCPTRLLFALPAAPDAQLHLPLGHPP